MDGFEKSALRGADKGTGQPLKMAAKMQRSRFERYQSQMILVHNFCQLGIEEALSVAEYCSATIGNMPEGSVLALTIMDSSAEGFDAEINGKFCKIFEKNRSKVKASAFVCPEGQLTNLFRKAATAAGRSNVRFFATEQEAKEWLVHIDQLR
jgi:hypothetical protein